MTDTAAETLPATDPWNQQLEQLRSRYRHARPAVLVALNILLGNPDIADADAKAQAEMHGFRITAASLGAARVLLERMDSVTPAAVANATPTPTPKPARKPKAADPTNDAEALVRTFVAKLQTHGNAEADRLREAIRKAVAVLQAAIGNAP